MTQQEQVIAGDNKVIIDYAMGVLQRLIEVGGAAVLEARIVGGAARDSYLTKPIKDIDLLVKFDAGTKVADRKAIILGAFDDSYTEAKFGEEIYGEDEELFARIGTVYGYDFEFIEVGDNQTIDDVIGTYPDSISKLSLDFKGRLVMTLAYETSLFTRTVQVKRGFGTRTRRLMSKFPEFAFQYEDDKTYIREFGISGAPSDTVNQDAE